MRTLTLGVLIVAGGTLASLPFRRYHSIPDASTGPLQATGPTQSELREANVEKLELLLADSNEPITAGYAGGSRGDNGRVAMLPAASRFAPAATGAAAAGSRMFPSTQPVAGAGRPADRSRQMSIPLTYEDLAVPIEQPKLIRQKYNATVDARQQRIESERAAGLVMPRIDSLAVSQQQEIQSTVTVVQSPGDSPSGRNSASSGAAANGRVAVSNVPSGNRVPPTAQASTQFASSSLPDPSEQPLAEAVPPAVQRHWIRQPD